MKKYIIAILMVLMMTGSAGAWQWFPIASSIVDGVTSQCPDSNSVFDGLAGKPDLISTGTANTFILGGNLTTTGSYNVGVGINTFTDITSGTDSVAIGHGALHSMTSSASNVAVGSSALTLNTDGHTNTAIGGGAPLSSNITGDDNTAIGAYTLVSNTTDDNTAIGSGAMRYTTTGRDNVAVGGEAMYDNTEGRSIVAVGVSACKNNLTGIQNVCVGAEAGYGATAQSFNYNTLVGAWSGSLLQTGSNNTLLGFSTGKVLTIGGNNILIGYLTGDNLTTGHDNIMIGHDLAAPAVDTHYFLNIGNVIYSDLSTGKIGIANTSPSEALEVGSNTTGKNVKVSATLTNIHTFHEDNWNEDDATWTMTTTGPLVHVTGNTIAITATNTEAIEIGRTYKVTIVGTGGIATATYTIGGVTGTTLASSGAIAIIDYITAISTDSLIITPASTCTVSISNIIIQKLPDATGDLAVEGNLKLGSPIQNIKGQDSLTIGPTGNVGIGTTSPGRKLSIYATSSPTIQLTNSTTNDTAAAGTYLQQSGLNGLLINQEAGYLGLGTDGSFDLYIQTGGNVGIGTTTPTEIEGRTNLRIGGGGYGGALVIDSETAEADVFRIWFGSGTSPVLNIETETANDIAFGTNNTERVRIASGGNVGIGTTSVGGKLDVSWGGYQATPSLKIGADIGDVSTRTNATRKFASIGVPHYINAEQNILFGFVDSDATVTDMRIGGGDNNWNAVTGIHFYTAADNTTITGTERLTINAIGLIVPPPTAQPITDAGITIAADICGGIKQIQSNSYGIVTTNTTNTFTAPATANAGCCMDVVNVGVYDIVLDSNANFVSYGAADVTLTPYDSIRVCSNGTDWIQITPLCANAHP